MIIPREKIPQGIQREVRQRCGFGCVICGNPLYDYDHMVNYSVTKRHIASELTLLCGNHHRDKTGKRMPLEKVLKANANPHNLKNNRTSPYQIEQFFGNSGTIIFGTIAFPFKDNGSGNFMIPLIVDGIPIIKFTLENSEIFLDFVIFDKYNVPILVVKRNELTFKIGFWDITYIGTTLKIRQGSRDIYLEIDFRYPNTVEIKRMKLFCNSKEFTINKHGFIYENRKIKLANFSIIAQVGIIVGLNPLNLHGLFHM